MKLRLSYQSNRNDFTVISEGAKEDERQEGNLPVCIKRIRVPSLRNGSGRLMNTALLQLGVTESAAPLGQKMDISLVLPPTICTR